MEETTGTGGLIDTTMPPNKSGFCKEIRKLVKRVRKMTKSSLFSFGKQKHNVMNERTRVMSMLPFPLPAISSGPSEKWDWDYYNSEDFETMHWGDEWGQFEEPRRVPMKCYDRQYYNEAFLIKRQAPPCNMHLHSDGERHCTTGSKLVSSFACRSPGYPPWKNDVFQGNKSYNTMCYMGMCDENSQEYEYPVPFFQNNASGENCGIHEKYCELPNRFQSYTKRYHSSDGNKRTLSPRIGTANIHKRKLKTFIPLRDDVNSKQGLRFRPGGKNTKWSSIKIRHERAKTNYEKMLQEKAEKRKQKKQIWELRLKVGLCKRNLQQHQKMGITKVEDELEKFYHLVYWIGHGQNSYNMVGRFYDMQQNRMVALKIFSHKTPPTSVERLENKLLALAEIKCLLEMDHQNVISLLRYFEKDEKMHLVLETCDHNLRTEISAAPKGIPEAIALSVIYQILQGLNYCHSKKCLHRDLCPENILITIDGVIKIADFDKAIFLNEVCGIFPPGTITYGSPELLARELDCGPLEVSDIWSVGVIFCELLLGSPLWNRETEKKQLEAIQEDMGFLFPRFLSQDKYNKAKEIAHLKKKFAGFSDETVLFIENCLRMDPSRRSSCSTLISHPFVKDLQAGKPTSALAFSLPLGGKLLPLPRGNFADMTDHNTVPNHSSLKNPIELECSDSDSDSNHYGKELAHRNNGIRNSKIPKTIDEKSNVSPRVDPYLPHKVTSERINGPNAQKKTMPLHKDSAKYSQSQMTIRESNEKYNLRNGSAGGDVDVKEEKAKQLLSASKDKPKKKSLVTPGVQGLIEALPNANWNAVPIFKKHFDLVKKFDPVAFKENIGSFITSLMKQIACTRTNVAGPAIKILTSLLRDNGEYFYPELDKIVHTLMQKIGGPFFIEHECCDALHSLVNMAPPVKLCLAFTNKAESKLKNANTRYVTSFYLYQAMSNLNIENDIGDSTPIQKKLTSAVFKTTLWLIQDQDPKTRRSAKDILGLLLQHPRFVEFYRTFVPENQLEVVHKVLKDLRAQNKGVPGYK